MKRVLKSLVLAAVAVVLLASCHKESSEKQILSFKFMSPSVEAVISEEAKTIVAVVPNGTDVTALVPVITVSEKATVEPASGMPQDFTNPVTYTVFAEDASQVSYVVTVTVDQNGGGGGGGDDPIHPTDPTQISGNIDQNTTWPDLGLDVDYILDGWIIIDGNALLTIEPGVTIMFTGVNGGLEVGENAGLRMVGTADKPIILEGPQNNPNNGSWNSVRINSKRTDNQFEYVQFLRGGSDEDNIWAGVVRVANGRLSMKNCLIDGGLGMGLVADYDDAFLTAFENNTIKNCAYLPVYFEFVPAACKNIGTGNLFSGNGYNLVGVNSCYFEMTENLTLHNIGYPYYLGGEVAFWGNKTMTIEPGVTLLFESERGLEIGDECNFVANGTADAPIIFDCIEDGEYWNGVHFRSHKNNNIVNYCQFGNGGGTDEWYGRCCFYIREDAKLTLTNNIFGPSFFFGVGIEKIDNWGQNVSQSGNSFVNCATGNVWIETDGYYNGFYYYADDVLEFLP